MTIGTRQKNEKLRSEKRFFVNYENTKFQISENFSSPSFLASSKILTVRFRRFSFRFVELLMMHLCIKAFHYLWNLIFFSLLSFTGHRIVGARLSQMGRVLRYTARLHRSNHLTLTSQQQKLRRYRSRKD